MKFLKVTWQDSGYHFSEGWLSLKEQLRDFSTARMTVVTAGILAEEDDEVIMLGLSFSEATNTWFGLQVIAKQNIKSIEVLSCPE